MHNDGSNRKGVRKMKTIIVFLVLFFAVSASQEHSIRFDPKNPISFVQFYQRNAAGITQVSTESNISYISAGNDIVISFDVSDSVYLKMETGEIKIIVTAELISKNGLRTPISVPGYSAVVPVETTFVQGNDSIRRVDYVLQTNPRKNKSTLYPIVETVIDLSMEKISEGDRLYVLINNLASNVTYSKAFEVRSFGWKELITPGAVWVKSYSTTNVNFQTAPAVTYMMYYDFEPNSNFMERIFQPAYGIHGIIIDINTTKTVGIGGSFFWFGRTTHVGAGAFLNSRGSIQDKLYYFVGINFLY